MASILHKSAHGSYDSEARLERREKSNINSQTMFKHYKSLIVSIPVSWCETWTPMEEKGIKRVPEQRLEKASPHLMHIQIQWLCTEQGQKSLLATIERQKIAWFGYVTRQNDIFTTMMVAVEVGWHRKSWLDNIKEWMNLIMPKLLRTTASKLSWGRLSISSVLRYRDDWSNRGTDNDNEQKFTLITF